MDLSYGDCMNFDGSACFALFGSCLCMLWMLHVCLLKICLETRLCIYLILNQVPGACNLLAPVCGSWSIVSRGSTLRRYVNPMGCQAYPSVSGGNRMVSRLDRVSVDTCLINCFRSC